MTDRVNTPMWQPTEDPSDLPRVLRALEKAFAEGREFEMAALDVAVLVRWIRELKESHEPPSSTDDSSR